MCVCVCVASQTQHGKNYIRLRNGSEDHAQGKWMKGREGEEERAVRKEEVGGHREEGEEEKERN